MRRKKRCLEKAQDFKEEEEEISKISRISFRIRFPHIVNTFNSPFYLLSSSTTLTAFIQPSIGHTSRLRYYSLSLFAFYFYLAGNSSSVHFDAMTCNAWKVGRERESLFDAKIIRVNVSLPRERERDWNQCLGTMCKLLSCCAVREESKRTENLIISLLRISISIPFFVVSTQQQQQQRIDFRMKISNINWWCCRAEHGNLLFFYRLNLKLVAFKKITKNNKKFLSHSHKSFGEKKMNWRGSARK